MALSRARTAHARARHARRSESLPVRRWLQVGAASAGVGAALMAFPLLGPQAVAVADPGTESSSTPASNAGSADPGATAPTGDTVTDTTADDPDGTLTDDTLTDDDDDAVLGDNLGEDLEEDLDEDLDDALAGLDDIEGDSEPNEEELDEEPSAEPGEESGEEPALGTGADEQRPAGSNTAGTETSADVPAPGVEPTPAPESRGEVYRAAALVDGGEDTVTNSAASTLTITPQQAHEIAPVVTAGWLLKPYHDLTATLITNITLTLQNLIDALPVDGNLKALLEGALWTVRRGFFNLAPSAAPIQVTGILDGPITGTLGVIDPEGDPIYYVITRGPSEGSVVLNADGTYTYTPGENFDGVDTFEVFAMDLGIHVNLLDPLRPLGVGVPGLINQNAITYQFVYTTGAELWTPEYRAALEEAARQLTGYLRVQKPVVLTLEVSGINDAGAGYLAYATSDLVGDGHFRRTAVQHEILTGTDANGDTADGAIVWNFAYNWGAGDVIGANQYDLESTAMHELVHAMGFLSYLGEPGDNNYTAWPVFSSLIVTSTRKRTINSVGRWDTQYDPNLLGHNGGLYLGGTHAVDAYGGPVPLYTPDPWEEGSSTNHLDDNVFTGPNAQLMNAKAGKGPGIRTLSDIEVGILRDLGYFAVLLPEPGSQQSQLV